MRSGPEKHIVLLLNKIGLLLECSLSLLVNSFKQKDGNY